MKLGQCRYPSIDKGNKIGAFQGEGVCIATKQVFIVLLEFLILCSSRAFTQFFFEMAPLINGFWGMPTSTIDWCEKNYEITYYVAEFCEYYN